MKEHPFLDDPKIERLCGLILASHDRLTGISLLPTFKTKLPVAAQLFEASQVIVAHNRDDDPILTFGNRQALKLWEMSWEDFCKTPSRLTAETPAQEERQRLLNQVTQNGFIDDYQGVRIAASGRRFRILQARVWNVFDDHGERIGQAATFAQWQDLPLK
jgi:hypothetical protein